MKPLRLLVMVAALIAAVCVSCPAYAEDFRATREEIDESQRYVATDEERREAADNRATLVGYSTFKRIFTGYNGIFNQIRFGRGGGDVGDGKAAILSVLGAGVIAAVGIVFAWWGIRKVVSMLFAAAWDGRFGSGLEARTKWWSATGKWR